MSAVALILITFIVLVIAAGSWLVAPESIRKLR